MKPTIVNIFGASWCSYCKKAIDLCTEKGVNYTYHDIDNEAALDILMSLQGNFTTVPQIFIDADFRHIGGYTELKELLDGEAES